MLKREGDRIWIDLDEFYPPSHGYPNTVFKALAIAFSAMKSEISYADLMGVSAAAFRTQVTDNLCPSSPHSHVGFSCFDLSREALEFELTSYPWKKNDAVKLAAAKKAAIASIERGCPAMTDFEETGLVVGYVDAGDLLIRDPYSNKGDKPTPMGDWSGWSLSTITRPPRKPTSEHHRKALEIAVKLAHEESLLGDIYYSGFAAYEHWIWRLGDDSILTGTDDEIGAAILGNAHIYYCLIDARRQAAEYLMNIKSLFPSNTHRHISNAANRYKDIANTLDAGWDNVPWPWKLKSVAEWTNTHRRNQASILERVLDLERLAIGHLESVTSKATE